MLSGKATRLKRLVSSLLSRPFVVCFSFVFLKERETDAQIAKADPSRSKEETMGEGGGGMERRHIKFCKQNTAMLIVLREVFCLQNLICLLFIFADQVFIDPTFSGIFVCGPLQSFVVNVCTG